MDLNKKRTIRNRKKLKSVSYDRYRITVSKSLNNISAQIIDDKNNKTLVSATSISEKGKNKKKTDPKKKEVKTKSKETKKTKTPASKPKKAKKVSKK